MEYQGGNIKIAKSISALNKMSTTKSGMKVLDELTSSKNSFDFTQQSIKEGTNAFVGNDEGGGTFYMNGSLGLENVAHEVFHGYQHELGSGKPSVNNEVGAYLFGVGVQASYSFSNGEISGGSSSLLGNDSQSGANYSEAMNGLFFGTSFNNSDYEKAIINFKQGAIKNNSGIYNSHPVIIPVAGKPLISNFFPLIE